MDPSLMTAEEIEARGRVVVEPCRRCHHLRQAHMYVPRYSERGLATIPVTACVACECPYYVGEDDG